MDKKVIKETICFYIDKELSYDDNGSSFSLVQSFAKNEAGMIGGESVTRERLDEVLNELISEGEVIMEEGICGPKTLIVSAFKPRTAARMLEAAGKKVHPKILEYI